ncbi:Haloacid Dehalogenase superfamily, subfamily IB, phosphoserine phosphatase-like/2,3-diketo-5-methylthio-1-phosphopentane phosphatase [Alkalithermobacter thermoalcaliphilus JW-YL-7 = DSM 7308]|uniref:phosphoserine phosphatase n=1 Tax=Alkalithermobacter thermoalcaliphilus JW-YL-7 = DSM 7308 TaxID=1121328 RepID=A0A150FSM8_CLOPD|nr:2,3-diketo-5-methylthio-1-phosphopentane phosphatase [[Clostridium] paradoxum JW-YL-7 = DSM 7308]SHL19776.1 Haloacid Dehalogenase superfamily, subfamily IB, phosphoserine phosphatase-like/2,3-diketo-5-methylthio-1-phosphopentane phosphatase [[Clostridium] paradoxum JW-YL-7 = DSM 7308]
MEYIVICDFDGTITTEDTCVAMAKKFAKGNYDQLEKMWIEGKHDAQYISQKILDMLDVNEQKLKEYIRSIKIDPYFKDFIDYIRKNSLEFYILSDGFDFNIDNILEENEINGIMTFSNILKFDNDKIIGIFPNKNDECTKCGNCKKNIIENINIDNKKIIYIGDGYSDRCASKLGDYIFAKGELAQYLKGKDIKFYEYENFKDIIGYIKKIK